VISPARLILFGIALTLLWVYQSRNSDSERSTLPSEPLHTAVSFSARAVLPSALPPNPEEENQPPAEEPEAQVKLLTDFQRNFFEKIPKKEQLKNLNEGQAHRVSKVVFESGQIIAEAREFFILNRVSAAQQTVFYLKCARNGALLESARALCAARAQQQYQLHTGKTMSRKIFEPRIAYLSSLISLD
jgi:hypothetical protein